MKKINSKTLASRFFLILCTLLMGIVFTTSCTTSKSKSMLKEELRAELKAELDNEQLKYNHLTAEVHATHGMKMVAFGTDENVEAFVREGNEGAVFFAIVDFKQDGADKRAVYNNLVSICDNGMAFSILEDW